MFQSDLENALASYEKLKAARQEEATALNKLNERADKINTYHPILRELAYFGIWAVEAYTQKIVQILEPKNLREAYDQKIGLRSGANQDLMRLLKTTRGEFELSGVYFHGIDRYYGANEFLSLNYNITLQNETFSPRVVVGGATAQLARGPKPTVTFRDGQMPHLQLPESYPIGNCCHEYCPESDDKYIVRGWIPKITADRRELWLPTFKQSMDCYDYNAVALKEQRLI